MSEEESGILSPICGFDGSEFIHVGSSPRVRVVEIDTLPGWSNDKSSDTVLGWC